MPSDLFFRGLNTVHRTVLKISGGRLGSDVANMPVLEVKDLKVHFPAPALLAAQVDPIERRDSEQGLPIEVSSLQGLAMRGPHFRGLIRGRRPPRDQRLPKMALPTRTMVAPSSTAM